MVAALGLVLLAGSILSTWQAVRATQAEQRATVNFDRAHEAVKRMLTRVAQEKLVGVPWMEPVRRALLQDALEFYEQLLAERVTDPEIRLATAETQLALAWLSWRFGDTANLEASYQRALGLMEGLVKEFPDDLHYRAALAAGLHHYSHRTGWDKQHWQKCVPILRRAVELQQSVVLARPDSADAAYDLANMLTLYGVTLRTGGRIDEAEAAFRRLMDIAEQALTKHPHHPGHLWGQIRGLTYLADLQKHKDPAQTEAMLLRAQGVAERFRTADWKTATYVDNFTAMVDIDRGLADLYLEKGRTQDAQAAYRRAVAFMQKFTADYPSDRFVRSNLSEQYHALARSLTGPDDREEAEQAWEQAIQIREKLAAELPQEAHYRRQLGNAYRGFAAWLAGAERFDEGEQAYRRALAVDEKLAAQFADNSDDINAAAWSAESLGRFLEEAERLDEAEALYRQSLKYCQTGLASQPKDTRHVVRAARLQRRLATLLRTAGRPEEAIKHCVSLVAESPRELDYRLLLSWVHDDIGRAADEAKRPVDAEAAFRQAVTVMEAATADFPKDAKAWENLGYRARSLARFLMTQKLPAEADKAWARGIDAFDTASALPDPVADNCRYWAAATRRALAESALAQGRPKEAEELWQKAFDMLQALPATQVQTDKRHRNITAAADRYAGWLRSQNRHPEAIAVMQRAIDFYAGLHAKVPTERIFREELCEQYRKLAWYLATAANPKARDAKRAVEAAKKAVDLTSEQGFCWTTLGAAHYRAGQRQDAVSALERAMELRDGGDSYDWFFLAMARWQLGDTDKGREWYDKAVEWMDKNQPNNEELRRLRGEAAELLELKDKK
jgi:tetratricopeptide (TPR) repeat protein